MKLTSLALLAALAVVPATVVACGGSVEAPQTAGTTKAPVGSNTHGFVKVAGEALGEVPLRADQRTELEKLATEADQRHGSMAEGRKELAKAIADQVESGTIDRAALQAKIDRVVADLEKVRPADQAAIARVHAILDSDQRNAFVDALENKLHEAREHHKGKAGFGHMMKLGAELGLTEAQRDQIKEVMKESRKAHAQHGRGPHERPEGWKAHRGPGKQHAGKRGGPHGPKRGLEAFRSDTFDPTAAGPHGNQGKMKERAAQGTTHMLDLAEKILPILTPEQRKIAAEKLRTMSERGETPFMR